MIYLFVFGACLPHRNGSSTESRVRRLYTADSSALNMAGHPGSTSLKYRLSRGRRGWGREAGARPTLTVPPVGWRLGGSKGFLLS